MTRSFQHGAALVTAMALFIATGTAEAARRPAAKTAPAAPAKTSAASHGVGKGDTEFGFFMKYTNYEGTNSSNNLNLGVSFGRYLTDSLELRVTPVVNYLKSGGFSNYGFVPYVTLEKSFPNRSIVTPYVGGGIGININYGKGSAFNITDLGIFVTPVGGLKFFVTERMALEYALGFQYGYDYNCVSGAGSTCNGGTRSEVHNDLRFNVYF